MVAHLNYSNTITFPVCRLVLAPSQTGWPQICSVSTAQRLNSCCWVSSLNWIQYKVLPALCLSNGVSVLPSASACNLGFIFDSNLTLADQISSVSRSCFYHIRDLRRIRPVLDFTTAQSIGTSVSVYFRCATIDMSLIQQNLFCWISIRSMVAHLK